MKKGMGLAVISVMLMSLCGVAAAQEQAASEAAPEATGITTAGAIAAVGACIGASLVIFGGAMGISRIASHATDSIARQPEAAAQMFLTWLLPAAMIEGAMLFAVVVCLLVVVG